MPGRRVVGVTGDVGLLVVRPAEGQLALRSRRPSARTAAVAGQADEVRRRVDVLLEGLEADGVVAEWRVPTLDLIAASIATAVVIRLALGMASSSGTRD